jgi:hypothetical protein
MQMARIIAVAVALAASGYFASYGTVHSSEAEATVARCAPERVILAQTRQQLQPRPPRRQQTPIQGGIGGFATLSGTEEVDFCCQSGEGSVGQSCGQYNPDTHQCTDFALHCAGSWSCQPGGSTCQCL